MLFNFRASGITESKHFRYFVECLARGIVNRVADELIIREATNDDQHRVPAANDKGHIWPDVVIGLFTGAKKWRKQVSFEMINSQVRFAEADSQSFRNGCTDHQRTSQTGAAGGSKRVDFRQAGLRRDRSTIE